MKPMYLSTALLACLFILCASRTIETPLKLLGLDIGRVAALSILLILAGRLAFSPVQEVTLNLGGILFFVITLLSALRSEEGVVRATGISILAAFIMLAAAYSGISEKGLAMAALCSPLFLICTPKEAFFAAAAAPLVLSIFVAAADLYFYGYALVNTGANEIFDAQICGAIIAGALLSALSLKRKTAKDKN